MYIYINIYPYKNVKIGAVDVHTPKTTLYDPKTLRYTETCERYVTNAYVHLSINIKNNS